VDGDLGFRGLAHHVCFWTHFRHFGCLMIAELEYSDCPI
jgi:hypothetical protein